MRYGKPLLALSLVVAVAAPALAGTVNVSFVNVSPNGGSLSISNGDGKTYNYSGGAGVYNLKWNCGSCNETVIPAFCIEISEHADHSCLPYDIVDPKDAPEEDGWMQKDHGPPMGSAKQEYLREFWGRYGPAYCDRDLSDWFASLTDAQKGAKAEAFQHGVWEIVFETLPADESNNFDLGDGWFKADETKVDATTVNTWLASLDGTGPKADLIALTRDGNQDYITVIPEPLSMVCVFLGVSGLAGYVRRRRTSRA